MRATGDFFSLFPDDQLEQMRQAQAAYRAAFEPLRSELNALGQDPENLAELRRKDVTVDELAPVLVRHLLQSRYEALRQDIVHTLAEVPGADNVERALDLMVDALQELASTDRESALADTLCGAIVTHARRMGSAGFRRVRDIALSSSLGPSRAQAVHGLAHFREHDLESRRLLGDLLTDPEVGADARNALSTLDRLRARRKQRDP